MTTSTTAGVTPRHDAPANGASDGTAKKSSATQRSSAYPSYPLAESLELTGKMRGEFGSNLYATREQVAEILGLSPGAVQQRLSTAVQYGLVELKAKQGYKVSDLFTKWYRPIDEAQKREMLLAAFGHPPLYQALIEKFKGDIVPSAKPLASILLQHHKISDSACDLAASIFLENAAYIGALDGERRLMLDGSLSPRALEPGEDSSAPQAADTRAHVPAVVTPDLPEDDEQESVRTTGESRPHFNSHRPAHLVDAEPRQIILKGGRKAWLYLPAPSEEMTEKDYNIILKQVELWRDSV